MAHAAHDGNLHILQRSHGSKRLPVRYPSQPELDGIIDASPLSPQAQLPVDQLLRERYASNLRQLQPYSGYCDAGRRRGSPRDASANSPFRAHYRTGLPTNQLALVPGFPRTGSGCIGCAHRVLLPLLEGGPSCARPESALTRPTVAIRTQSEPSNANSYTRPHRECVPAARARLARRRLAPMSGSTALRRQRPRSSHEFACRKLWPSHCRSNPAFPT